MILVEGPIGVGKSELLKALKHVLGERCAVIEEIVPLEDLKAFLNHQARGTAEYNPELTCLSPLNFQLRMAASRIIAQNAALEAEKTKKYVFMERSIWSDALFADLCVKEPENKEIYRQFCEGFLHPAAVKPDLCLFLNGTMDAAFARMKRRGRPKEEWYYQTPEGREYATRLSWNHDRYFLDKTIEYPVMTLNPDTIDWTLKPGLKEGLYLPTNSADMAYITELLTAKLASLPGKKQHYNDPAAAVAQGIV